MPRNRRGGRPSIGRILAFFFFAVVFSFMGTGPVWTEHFGARTRMTVECSHSSSRLPLPTSWTGADCWGSSSAGVQGPLKVYGAGFGDVGHDIDVHILAGVAVKDGSSPWAFVYFLGFGLLSGFIAIRLVVRRLRPALTV